MGQVSQNQRQAQKMHLVKSNPTKKGDTAHYLPFTLVAHSSEKFNGVTGQNSQT